MKTENATPSIKTEDLNESEKQVTEGTVDKEQGTNSTLSQGTKGSKLHRNNVEDTSVKDEQAEPADEGKDDKKVHDDSSQQTLDKKGKRIKLQ